MTDSEIIALLNQRDETAVSAIAARFGGLCHSLAANILHDKRDVEECVSNVFFKLWSSIPPAEPQNLTAYVAKTARNEALMRYRANSAGRIVEPVPLQELEDCLAGPNAAEADLDAKWLSKALEDFVRRLPAEQRGVFMRRYWFFDSAKCIADRFGTTEKRINTLLAKTRRQLRSYLKKEGYFNE